MENVKKSTNPNPRAKANPISALVFWWTFKIFRLGYSRDMDVNDLYEPLKDHMSNELGDQLEKSWETELKLVKEGKKKSPKLLSALLRIFGLRYMFDGFIVLIMECVVKVAQPVFLGYLINYFSGDTTISEAAAYGYATGVVLCTGLTLLLHHPSGVAMMHLGMQARVACCSAVYRKGLRLSQVALGQTTAGQAVNLLSNDVNRFDTSILHLHYLWIGFVQIIIVGYLMWVQMGWAAIIGLLSILVFIPIQMLVGRAISKLRLKTAICTDERVRRMNEIILGIQVIKMYAWEKPFADLIAVARRMEIKQIRYVSYIRGFLLSVVMFVTRVTLYVTCVSYVLFGNELTSETVFVVSALCNLLRITMTMFFPQGIAQLAEVLVSITRIQEFLLLGEIQEVKYGELETADSKKEFGVEIKDGCANWSEESHEPTLTNINVKMQSGQLVAVIGPVGSGKTSLIQVILGELPVTSGTIKIKGSQSYACQEPWLFTGSVQSNITFGQPWDPVRYKEVVKVCALERDFELLPYGDRTIVGERGVSLSGGQRARVSLARAVYKKADIYLLDDPLSAVDAHVGRHLFDDCIKGFLRHKAVLLVTHQLQYLTQASAILILNNGKQEALGTYTELQSTGLDFARLLEDMNEDGDEEEKTEDESDNVSQSSLGGVFKRITSLKRQVSKTKEKEVEVLNTPTAVTEIRTEGAVSGEVYKKYFRAGGNWLTFINVFGLMILAQVFASFADYWVSYWTTWEEEHVDSTQFWQYMKQTFNEWLTTNRCIYIYTIFIIGTIVVSLLRAFLFYAMCMRSSINLHGKMFSAISRTTMLFFNNNPSGRILNRFSKDIGGIDEVLPSTMIDAIQIFLTLLGIFVIVAIVNYWLIIPTVLISILFYFMQIIYVSTSRSVKRLEGITRSPVFTHLNASIQGLTTIRAFRAQDILEKQFDEYQDLHSSAWYLFISTSRSFAFWLDVVCFLYIGVVTYSFLLMDSENVNGSDVGLAITQVIGMTGFFQWGMRQSAELENQMTSVERVLEFSDLESEPPLETAPENEPPKDWAKKGEIKFDKLLMRYSPDDPPVLKGISFIIKPGEKIGVVGRTGAGKSSLIAALFRLADVYGGKILIDGVDASSLGLHKLRGNISIIPQEPVLFSGTMRKNLDPFSEYPDDVLWTALQEVELKEAVAELTGGLDAHMSEGGSNFSVGQRQLVCLARAVVRNNNILVLDEATANVDPKTDALIQSTIRRKFGHCTVLTIAHRLNTVMDSDRVLVMDAGIAAELEPPADLLDNPNSMLFSLAEQTGHASLLILKQKANEARASKM